MPPDSHDRDTLAAFGASGDVLDELLAYTANPFETGRLDSGALPLPDAPHLEAWDDYAREAARDGVLRMLGRRLVQFRFPVASGISSTDAYHAATRRGEWPPDSEPGLTLEAPDDLDLVLHPTPAGRVPVISCGSRADFVQLVRACSCRNEPDVVPPAMGACIVNGLNNWDRVARLRRRLEAEHGGPFTTAEWTAAFRAVMPQKTLYQDRLILLSREPYSAVPAPAVQLDEATWRARSVVIRREHECTHYFTLVAFGSMRNNLLDECIADAAGLGAAFGRYEAALALRVLGLERYPTYRAGGRFENYLGTPPLSSAAAVLLQGIVVRAATALEAATTGLDLSVAGVRHHLVSVLAGCTLPALAADAGGVRLREAIREVHS